MNAYCTAESYANLYQKIVDISGKSNYVIILNNRKILYSVDGKVKMLPEMKINVVDYSSFDSIFVGAFYYAVGMGLNIDDAIKLANTAAGLSISKIGEVASIPTLDEVLDNSGLRAKIAPQSPQNTEPVQAQEVSPLNPQIELPQQEQVIQQPMGIEQNQGAVSQPQMQQTLMPQQILQSQPNMAKIQQYVETNTVDTPNV